MAVGEPMSFLNKYMSAFYLCSLLRIIPWFAIWVVSLSIIQHAEADPVRLPSEEISPDAELNQTEVAAPTVQKKLWVDRFVGSQVFVSTYTTGQTLFSSEYLSSNDTVGTSVFMAPRFQLTQDLQLRANLGFEYEFTNSDFSTRENQLIWYDALLQLVYFRAVGHGLSFNFTGDIGLPLSKASQAMGRYLSLGAQLLVVQQLPKMLGGKFTLLGGTRYREWLAERNTVDSESRPSQGPTRCYGGGVGACGHGQISGYSVRRQVGLNAAVVGQWGLWQPGVSLGLNLGFLHSTQADAYSEQDASGREIVLRDTPSNDLRTGTSFRVWLDRTLLSWLVAEVSYSYVRARIRNQNGHIGTPFGGKDYPMTLAASLIVRVDELQRRILGLSPGVGGVVRN